MNATEMAEMLMVKYGGYICLSDEAVPLGNGSDYLVPINCVDVDYYDWEFV